MDPQKDRKRKREIEAEVVQALCKKYTKVKPENAAEAFQGCMNEIGMLNEQINNPESLLSLPATSLGLWEARRIFQITSTNRLFWEDIQQEAVPQYLLDNVDRIMEITDIDLGGNKAFSRAIIDQILISAIYEERYDKRKRLKSLETTGPAGSSCETTEDEEEPTLLQLRHKTQIQKKVIHKGTPRLLSGFADYSVWYDSSATTTLATNLIIVNAKKRGYTDPCLAQLTAYMGAIHSLRKEEGKDDAIVYGAVTDGLHYRFCRVNNEGQWSESRMYEWDNHGEGKIYSTFKKLIRIAALSSPSACPTKDSTKREKVFPLAAFRTSSREQKYDFDLADVGILEEDSDTELIGWPDLEKSMHKEPWKLVERPKP